MRDSIAPTDQSLMAVMAQDLNMTVAEYIAFRSSRRGPATSRTAGLQPKRGGEALEIFLSSLTREHVTDETLRTYRGEITRFLVWTGEPELHLHEISRGMVREYLNLKPERVRRNAQGDVIAPATYQKKLAIFRSYFQLALRLAREGPDRSH